MRMYGHKIRAIAKREDVQQALLFILWMILIYLYTKYVPVHPIP